MESQCEDVDEVEFEFGGGVNYRYMVILSGGGNSTRSSLGVICGGTWLVPPKLPFSSVR